MQSAAAIFTQPGQALLIDEVEYAEPGPDHVFVRLFATGVCHSQLHQMHDPETPTPTLIGHEGTGVVEQIGREVTHARAGDHVIMTCPRSD